MRRAERRLTLAAAALLTSGGLALGLAGWRLGDSRPRQPPVAGGGAHVTGPARAAWPRAAPRPMPYSRPVRVSIPAIGVRAPLVGLGENADGSVRVPPLSQPSEVSWFDRWPAPGQRGPAVLYGHVNIARTGPAVFYRLGDLRPGDLVRVTRADGRTAVFRVSKVTSYAKSAFPAHLVYDSTRGPRLRLITCGGTFDPATGSYLDNTIVFARLIAARGRGARDSNGRIDTARQRTLGRHQSGRRSER